MQTLPDVVRKISARLLLGLLLPWWSWPEPVDPGGKSLRVSRGEYTVEIGDDDYESVRRAGETLFLLRLRHPGDGFESDDSLAAARRLPSTVSGGLRFLLEGDSDDFFVDLAHPGIVHASLGSTPRELRLKLRFMNPGGEVLARCHGVFRLSRGRIFIEVTEVNGRVSEALVNPRVAFLPETDAHEPNDSLEQETRLLLDEALTLSLLPLGDRDHFRVAIPRDGDHVVLAGAERPLEPRVLVPGHAPARGNDRPGAGAVRLIVDEETENAGGPVRRVAREVTDAARARRGRGRPFLSRFQAAGEVS